MSAGCDNPAVPEPRAQGDDAGGGDVPAPPLRRPGGPWARNGTRPARQPDHARPPSAAQVAVSSVHALRRLPVGDNDLKRAAGAFPTGVAVVTAVGADGTRVGLTVNSFTSVSLDPPLVLVCVHRRAPSLSVIEGSRRFGISILGKSQQALALRFAKSAEDKFEGLPWRVGVLGVPLLDGALAHVECILARVFDGGDHEIVLGYVQRANTYPGEPLIFHRSRLA
jgi:flavin reductase (DIM6/NTAB) family NADH-FMN oxidoreductase RutF